MVVLYLIVGPVAWGIAGLMAGLVTSAMTRRSAEYRFHPWQAWSLAMTAGGFAWPLASALASLIFHAVVRGPYLWGWDVIPTTFGIAAAAAVTGLLGQHLTYAPKRRPSAPTS